MNAAGVYRRVSALLDDYLHPFGMSASAGPLRAVAELTVGIVWTGSVQLSNAARLFARTPGELEHAVKRLSQHLADPAGTTEMAALGPSRPGTSGMMI
jgi:hypothetical protein